jgi:hypothetical protein
MNTTLTKFDCYICRISIPENLIIQTFKQLALTARGRSLSPVYPATRIPEYIRKDELCSFLPAALYRAGLTKALLFSACCAVSRWLHQSSALFCLLRSAA